jgi:pyridoxamine 5'-phosphate oxidase
MLAAISMRLRMPLDPTDLDPDPIVQLGRWLSDAERSDVPLPNAFALATADGDGQPSVRFLLLRGLDAKGLHFYTNRASRKGRDIAVNPWASAAFWWPALDRQARVAGPVRQLPDDASQAYWRTRPRGSQLEARVMDVAERHPGEVPLPPTWGGYLLIPHAMEFWESRADRLHDRIEYLRGADGSWHRRRLQP